MVLLCNFVGLLYTEMLFSPNGKQYENVESSEKCQLHERKIVT